jgi:hypothetical protein
MRWGDEPYVRAYKRDTSEWAALLWQARALFWELLRKADMTGFISMGKSGTRGLAGLVRMPVDVVELGLYDRDGGLLADGCVQEVEGGLQIVNYIEAQSAPQTDRLRKQEQRERDRSKKLGGVTKRDKKSERLPEAPEQGGSNQAGTPKAPVHDIHLTGQPVTNCDNRSGNVTQNHDSSRSVTNGHSDLSCTELSREEIQTGSSSSLSQPGNRPDSDDDESQVRADLAAALRAALKHSDTAYELVENTRAVNELVAACSSAGLDPGGVERAVEWADDQLRSKAAFDGYEGRPCNFEVTLAMVKSGIGHESKGRIKRAEKLEPAGTQELFDELRAHRVFDICARRDLAVQLARFVHENGGKHSLATVIDCMRGAATKIADLTAGGEVFDRNRTVSMVVRFAQSGPPPEKPGRTHGIQPTPNPTVMAKIAAQRSEAEHRLAEETARQKAAGTFDALEVP